MTRDLAFASPRTMEWPSMSIHQQMMHRRPRHSLEGSRSGSSGYSSPNEDSGDESYYSRERRRSYHERERRRSYTSSYAPKPLHTQRPGTHRRALTLSSAGMSIRSVPPPYDSHDYHYDHQYDYYEDDIDLIYHRADRKISSSSEPAQRLEASFSLHPTTTTTIPRPTPVRSAQSDDTVFLENVELDKEAKWDSSKVQLTGSVIARNVAFEKRVSVRYSLDGWKTFENVGCTFVRSVLAPVDTAEGGENQPADTTTPPSMTSNTMSTDSWDRFTFTIPLSLSSASSFDTLTISMAVCYVAADAGEWWDNNEGKNYEVVVKREWRVPPYIEKTQRVEQSRRRERDVPEEVQLDVEVRMDASVKVEDEVETVREIEAASAGGAALSETINFPHKEDAAPSVVIESVDQTPPKIDISEDIESPQDIRSLSLIEEASSGPADSFVESPVDASSVLEDTPFNSTGPLDYSLPSVQGSSRSPGERLVACSEASEEEDTLSSCSGSSISDSVPLGPAGPFSPPPVPIPERVREKATLTRTTSAPSPSPEPFSTSTSKWMLKHLKPLLKLIGALNLFSQTQKPSTSISKAPAPSHSPQDDVVEDASGALLSRVNTHTELSTPRLTPTSIGTDTSRPSISSPRPLMSTPLPPRIANKGKVRFLKPTLRHRTRSLVQMGATPKPESKPMFRQRLRRVSVYVLPPRYLTDDVIAVHLVLPRDMNTVHYSEKGKVKLFAGENVKFVPRSGKRKGKGTGKNSRGRHGGP